MLRSHLCAFFDASSKSLHLKCRTVLGDGMKGSWQDQACFGKSAFERLGYSPGRNTVSIHIRLYQKFEKQEVRKAGSSSEAKTRSKVSSRTNLKRKVT
jgi:hypothetical protein